MPKKYKRRIEHITVDELKEFMKKSKLRIGKFWEVRDQKYKNSVDVPRDKRKNNEFPHMTNEFKAYLKILGKKGMAEELVKAKDDTALAMSYKWDTLKEKRLEQGFKSRGGGTSTMKKEKVELVKKEKEAIDDEQREKELKEIDEKISKTLKDTDDLIKETKKKGGEFKEDEAQIHELKKNIKKARKDAEKEENPRKYLSKKQELNELLEGTIKTEKEIVKTLKEEELEKTKGKGKLVSFKEGESPARGKTDVLKEITAESEDVLGGVRTTQTEASTDELQKLRMRIQKLEEDRKNNMIVENLTQPDIEDPKNLTDSQVSLTRGRTPQEPVKLEIQEAKVEGDIPEPDFQAPTLPEQAQNEIVEGTTQDVDVEREDIEPTFRATHQIEKESEDRNKKTISRLRNEIECFKQIYENLIKTSEFKKLSKMKDDKMNMNELRKLHEDFSNEIRSYYEQNRNLKIGVIVSPESLGLNIGRMQNLLAPRLPNYMPNVIDGVMTKPSPMEQLKKAGKIDTSKQPRVREDAHYKLGGIKQALGIPHRRELAGLEAGLQQKPAERDRKPEPPDNLGKFKMRFYNLRPTTRIAENIKIKT